MGECTYPNVNHGSSIIRAGRVFIYFPFKSFSQTQSFPLLGRGGALLDRVWFPDPLPNTWSRTESRALWYGMGKNIGFMGQFCGWDFIDKTGG